MNKNCGSGKNKTRLKDSHQLYVEWPKWASLRVSEIGFQRLEGGKRVRHSSLLKNILDKGENQCQGWKV